MKTHRRQAREIALQALYAWQLSGDDPLAQARSIEGFQNSDARFVESLLRGVLERADELRGLISPHLNREFGRLSPIERAILYIGTFELAAHPETPFKVVLNEASSSQSFGATDGYASHGVARKNAAALRPRIRPTKQRPGVRGIIPGHLPNSTSSARYFTRRPKGGRGVATIALCGPDAASTCADHRHSDRGPPSWRALSRARSATRRSP